MSAFGPLRSRCADLEQISCGAAFIRYRKRELDTTFPLTPTLSLKERENRSQSLDSLPTLTVSPVSVCLKRKLEAGAGTEALRLIGDGHW